MPLPTSLIRRTMATQEPGGLACLDAVSWPAAGGRAFRAFFATGTAVAAFDTALRDGAATLTEVRDVSGGVLVAGFQADAGPTLALPLVDGVAGLRADAAEQGLFSGLNAAILIRCHEPAATVAEWLIWHHRHHGLQGAVIVDRILADGLADALEPLIRDLGLVIVVLGAPVPLGEPDKGAETDPFLAPDAPGKDRMTPPPPDPWRAPLGEMVIYEIVKWRFLAQARAVLNLDISDILAPVDGLAPVFDRALAAPQGVLLLIGWRVYPWRVRQAQSPVFGDHVCKPFDAATAQIRWCAAPEVSGLEATWRQSRVSYTKPDSANGAPFYRCMAIRHPGQASAVLAPKTSLIEDAALLALAGQLGHKPIRAPKSLAKAPAPDASRTAIVTTMKNEGPFILEWLAYHRAIGIDDFLIYTNDCTDGTDRMLEVLQAKGLVQHRDNPFRTMDLKPQHAALQAAESEPLIQNATWIICMDVDEFINIKVGDGRLADLYAALPDANMISMTWRLFGNHEVQEFKDRFITGQFSRCAPELTRKPHHAWGFKTLFRKTGIFKKLGVHRPKGLKPDLWDQIHWYNGSGKPMPLDMLRNSWRSTATTYGYDLVSLNHYAVRSADSFLVKRDRGRVNHVDRDQGMNYWFRMNFNADEDCSIQRMMPLLRAEYDRLLADPDIRAAHDHSVACHRKRIAELHADPVQAAFYAELVSDRMQRLCRMQAHFGSNVFTAGPEVIPDEVALLDQPPGFFFTVRLAAEPSAAENEEAEA